MALSEASQKKSLKDMFSSGPLRLILSLGIAALTFFILTWGVGYMRQEDAPKLAILAVALIVGVGGIWALYWVANDLLALIPMDRVRDGIRPYIFIGPAVLLLAAYLVYPAINTTFISFFDARSQNFVGLDNYVFIFTEPKILVAFRNNILWMVVVTSFSVVIGLVFARLVDRVRYEAVAKMFIFLPLVISFVGASVIWRFVYAFSPPGRPQIGLLNAIVVALGGDPVGWLIQRPGNNFALMAIMIWMQTGFAMVILSAALKAVPTETLEAANIDGANEFQAFFRVIIPQIRTTIITVATTILIGVLKVFDVVYVMTSGQFETEVIANRMYAEMFRFRNFGHGSALAVVMLVAVIPVMVVNIRNLRRQRSM